MAAPMRIKCLQNCFCQVRVFNLINKSCHLAKRSAWITSSRLKSTATQPTEYCFELVQKCDYESYLCTLLYAKQCQASAFALRALYIELAQVPDITSDSMRAIMRFQFWKDTIDKAFKGTPPETPVAVAVARAIKKHTLSKIWFSRILEARVDQVGKDSYRSVKEVEDAADNTVSALSYLLLETAGIKDVNADHAASHLGRCQGLVTLLRGTMFHAKRNKVYIPTEILLKNKVSQEQILRCKDDDNVQEAVYDIACQALTHLDTARSLKDNVPKEAYPFFLNAHICDKYLQDLQKVNFNVFHELLHKRTSNLAWSLWKQKNIKRTY